jgi:hypothetical protein
MPKNFPAAVDGLAPLMVTEAELLDIEVHPAELHSNITLKKLKV